jgi:hypothetical protein
VHVRTYGGPQTSKLISYTQDQAAAGEIDATSNLAGDKVYVFSGSKDTAVKPSVVKALEPYYEAFNTAPLETEYTLAAQHCIPTLNYGETCEVKKSPYIGKCDYAGAAHAFQTLYGTSMTAGSAKASNLFQFDQIEFFFWHSNISHSLTRSYLHSHTRPPPPPPHEHVIKAIPNPMDARDKSFRGQRPPSTYSITHLLATHGTGMTTSHLCHLLQAAAKMRVTLTDAVMLYANSWLCIVLYFIALYSLLHCIVL